MGTLQGLKENSGSRALCVAVGAGATAEQLQVEVQPSGTKVWIAAHSFEADHDEISKMSIFDACAKSRWTVLLGRLVSAFKMPDRGIKEAAPTTEFTPSPLPTSDWDQTKAPVTFGKFTVPGVFQRSKSRWAAETPTVTADAMEMDPRTKASLQEDLWMKDQSLKWLTIEDRDLVAAKDAREEECWGKAVLVALHSDNDKAITHAFGLHGANLFARVQNVQGMSSIMGVMVEHDLYLGYALFTKTSDGERSALDGARGTWGDLKCGYLQSLDAPLIQYEVTDTALDMAVRNGKWKCAAALINLNEQHPLNPQNEASDEPIRPLSPEKSPYRRKTIEQAQEATLDPDKDIAYVHERMKALKKPTDYVDKTIKSINEQLSRFDKTLSLP